MTLLQRLGDQRVLLAPGVYDALTALLAEQAGFEVLYLSGASIAYTRLGRSDVGLTTFSEVEDTLARISAAELAARGFRIVIVPGGTARAAAHALQAYFGSLQLNGTTMPWRERMLDFDALNALLGTPQLLEQGRRYELGKDS